jgi:tRNA(Arg) A34 adenosine deaminase TadA
MPKRHHQLTAVIYDKRGRVLSVGQNNYVKTHPLQKKHAEKVGEPYRLYVHAEIAAIVKCQNLKRAHKISIFRYNSDGQPALAKPCPVCLSAIKASGINYIEHT